MINADITDQQFAVLSNGMRLHYVSAGRRGQPLLLCLHGFPEFSGAWDAQLQAFGETHFVVAPDLRGFNLSSMPVEVAAYKARHIVEDLQLLIAYLGYQDCILLAHDWGGAIAWNIVIGLPDLVQKLIIINAPHPYLFMQALTSDPVQQAASTYMNWLRAPGAEVALAKNEFALMDRFFTAVEPADGRWFDAAVRQRYHAVWQRGVQGALNYYRASPLYPPTAADPAPLALAQRMNEADFRVTVPTRVIWATADTALPVTLLDGLDRFVDDLHITRIEGASHWVVHEQPALINKLIVDFLN